MKKTILIPEENNIAAFLEKRDKENLFLTNDEITKKIDDYIEKNYSILKPKLKSIIDNAIKKNKKILLYGDYDVDGCGSATIIYKFLQSLGIQNIDTIFPNRGDGYGINLELFDKNIYDIFIFCDCGISDVNNLKQIKTDRNNIILIDHHTENKEVNKYIDVLFKPNDVNISTGGLAYLFTEFLNKDYCRNYENLSSYAGLTQLSDMVELKGISYLIAKLGYNNLIDNENTKNIVNQIKTKKDIISSQFLVFKIIPVLNAISRMTSNSKMLFDVLNGSFKDIQQIESINKQRKSSQNEIIDLVENKYDVLTKAQKNKCIIVVDNNENIGRGLLGPIANHFTGKYNVPTFILSKVNGSYAGSSRGNISVYDALNSTKEYLSGWGGHAFAAGFSLKENNLKTFIDNINSFYKSKKVEVQQYYDTDFNNEFIDAELINIMNQIEPFGNGNEQPKIAIVGLVNNIYKINDQITKIEIVQDNMTTQIVNFYNISTDDIRKGKRYSFVYNGIDSEPFCELYSDTYKIIKLNKKQSSVLASLNL